MKLDHDFWEKVVLYKSLTDEQYLSSVVDYINPKHFKDIHIRGIIEIIVDYHQRRDTCPTVTEIKALLTTDALKASFKTAVSQFTQLDSNINTDELYDNTETFFKEKAVFHTMLEIADEMDKGTSDASVMLEKFEKACNINLTTDSGIELYGDVERVIADINQKDPVIKSGWEWLDKKLGGGFRRNGRALYVFAGRPNVGKSMWLSNIASNIAEQGLHPLLITLEMSEMVYARRLYSDITGIPVAELETSTDALRRDISKYTTRKLNVKEFPPSTITPKQLSAFIKKFKAGNNKVDVIIVDYMNLLKSPVGSNLYERVKYIVEQLRAMSYIFNCPVITATQLNREGFDADNPGLNTLSESAAVPAVADWIFAAWKDEEDEENCTIHGSMIKNRFERATGTALFSIDYMTLTISELADLDDEPDIEDQDGYAALRGMTRS